MNLKKLKKYILKIHLLTNKQSQVDECCLQIIAMLLL
jgi:hypothetical protein